MDSVTPFIVLSSILFTIGAVGVLTRRNAIVVFMCVELMLNASNLALVTFSRVLAARGTVKSAPEISEDIKALTGEDSTRSGSAHTEGQS